jgi:hypothetical protein
VVRKKKGVPAVNYIWNNGMKCSENFVFVVVTLIHPSAFTMKVGSFPDGHEHFPASVSIRMHVKPPLAAEFSWEGEGVLPLLSRRAAKHPTSRVLDIKIVVSYKMSQHFPVT